MFSLKFSYKCEKWCLINVQILNVIILIIIAILCDQISDSLSQNSDTNSLFGDKTAFIIVITISTILSIIFFIIGIYGTYNQNHCLFITFTVFITIFTIYVVFTSIIILYVIPLSVVNILLTALCIKHYFTISDNLYYFNNFVQHLEMGSKVGTKANSFVGKTLGQNKTQFIKSIHQASHQAYDNKNINSNQTILRQDSEDDFIVQSISVPQRPRVSQFLY